MPDVSVASSTIAAGVLLGGMLGLIALGLSIILGVMRLVNLAHGEFLLARRLFRPVFRAGLPASIRSSRCPWSRSSSPRCRFRSIAFCFSRSPIAGRKRR